MTTPYQILNVHPHATREEIRVAYLDQACQNHPSKQIPNQHPAIQQARFRRAAEAYILIGNDSRRQISDLALGINGKGQAPSSSIQTTRGRHRSSSEASGADALWNTHIMRDRLPPGLRSLLAELDPIKVFNRVLIEIDNERQQKLAQITDHSQAHDHHQVKLPFRKPPSPECVRTYKRASQEYHAQPARRDRPTSILSGSSSSAGKHSPRNSACSSSHRRRVSFTDQTIADDERKKLREAIKADPAAFSNLSLYSDVDHQGLSSSAPLDSFLNRKRHPPALSNTGDQQLPWSSLHLDDPRLQLGGSKESKVAPRRTIVSTQTSIEISLGGNNKTRTEEELQTLCKFLNELDTHGSFDEEMAKGLYEGGVRRKEALLEMSKEEVCMFLSRLGMDGKLTAFQEATLPRKLEIWKTENRLST